MAKIKVTAGKGRTVPMPRTIATAPGNRLLYVREGDELEVEASDSFVARALRDGDLVRLPAAAAAPSSPTTHEPAKES